MTTNVITAVVTAYCACTEICCPKSSKGICANNRPPVQGTTIAASRTIPLGSSVIVAGHTYIVQDRLAKRYDKRFDIYFSSHQAAKNFGIKTQTVVVIIK